VSFFLYSYVLNTADKIDYNAPLVSVIHNEKPQIDNDEDKWTFQNFTVFTQFIYRLEINCDLIIGQIPLNSTETDSSFLDLSDYA